MGPISYAQNGEDVVLARAFGDQDEGTYVDVGAAHPIDDSVTYGLYLRGWRGVNIEPNPELFEELEHVRPDDRNLNIGVSDQPGHLTFWQAPSQVWGRSTFSEAAAIQLESEGHTVRPIAIPVVTLAEVLAELTAPADILKIDVEGFETEVIAGANLVHQRPKVLVVEVIDPGTARRCRRPWEQQVADAGYRETLFDGVNAFYVHPSAAHLAPALSVPANVTDGYESWHCMKSVTGLERYLDLNRRLAARELARAIRDAVGLEGAKTAGLEGVCLAVLADRPEIIARRTAHLVEVLTLDDEGPVSALLSARQRRLAERLVADHGTVEVLVQR
jgi:FkbM family methyltransferase